MSNWSPINKKLLPPDNILILVKQNLTGVCLRKLICGEWYDENENIDDSELEIYEWAYIPE